MASPIPKFKSIRVSEVFDRYPDIQCEQLFLLRRLIFETAAELGIDDLEETLKWGEPSYVTNQGSTVRVAWRKLNPEQVGIFFNCKTTLIETFREIYRDQFKFEGNRAIVFDADDAIPQNEVKQCIALSLTYHKIKHLPMLGI